MTAELVPQARRDLWRAARCFELLRTHSEVRKLLFEEHLSLGLRQATHTLGEEVGYGVDVLHELRDFHREMFVAVHVG